MSVIFIIAAFLAGCVSTFAVLLIVAQSRARRIYQRKLKPIQTGASSVESISEKVVVMKNSPTFLH